MNTNEKASSPEWAKTVEAQRVRLRIPKRELARRAGLAHTTVNKLLKGESSPRPASVRAIARALGIDELALLREAGVVTEAEAPIENELGRRLLSALGKIPESKRLMAVELFERQWRDD